MFKAKPKEWPLKCRQHMIDEHGDGGFQFVRIMENKYGIKFWYQYTSLKMLDAVFENYNERCLAYEIKCLMAELSHEVVMDDVDDEVVNKEWHKMIEDLYFTPLVLLEQNILALPEELKLGFLRILRELSDLRKETLGEA